MGPFLLRLLLNAVALLVVANFLPGVHVASLNEALVAALILGVVNAILRPVLILITLPAVVLTLGLFTFVINAITFYLVAQMGLGLRVDDFRSAFFGALVLSIVSYVISNALKESEATA